MKITYTLYSGEYPDGKTLAIVYDHSQTNVLEPYYRNIYGTRAFKVTKTISRKKPQWVCGTWEE